MEKMKSKVLIIDDEQEIGNLLVAVLCSMGFVAEHKCDLKSGLEAFENKKHEIVFLDLRLPDGEGLSIVPKLKEGNSETTIIVISGHGAQEEKHNAFLMGVNYFLQKPFNTGQIQLALQN